MYEQTKHLTPCRRDFSLLPRIGSIGFLPAKCTWVRKTFQSCNFSFILNGCGEYLFRGENFPVEAPCMLIQWPGEPMNYGPNGRWSELYSFGFNTSPLGATLYSSFFHFCIRLVYEPCKSGRNTPMLCVGDSLL